MVELTGVSRELRRLGKSLARLGALVALVSVAVATFLASCTSRVDANEWGVQQHRFGAKTGVGDEVFGPGLYVVGLGTTMHTFPREIHMLEASYDQAEARAKVSDPGRVDAWFASRNAALGRDTFRTIDALNIQTSDGYAVLADVTLLYSIQDPVRIARDFGWGSLYVDSFVVSTFRNGVLATLGKMNAEAFYDETVRVAVVKECEGVLRQRFEERGLAVQKLLLRGYHYQPSYERSLHDKKVAVQLNEKNHKESLVNDERAKLQQIESKGNATITIAASEVDSKIAKIRAEADLYASQVHASADQEVGLAHAEAKRLKADALNKGGARYVVALETAKIFDNIRGGVMTPEQYIAFVRNAWALLGLSPGSAIKEGAPSP